MLNKRDILHEIIILYLSSSTVLINGIKKNHILNNLRFRLIFQNVIVNCIWIPYLQKSLRVKEIFVNTYVLIEYEYCEAESGVGKI